MTYTYKDAFIIASSVFTIAFCLILGYVVFQEYNHTIQLETVRQQSIERVCKEWNNTYPQTKTLRECEARYL